MASMDLGSVGDDVGEVEQDAVHLVVGPISRGSTDTRVIISTYRIEKFSEDHPCILRYTPEGLGCSSITRITPI